MARKKITAPGNGDKTYMLRTCEADMSAHGGFVWPVVGPVECPDWNPEPFCGGGLHGLLMGEGDGSLLDWSADAKWLIVEIAIADMVKLDGGKKVKVPRGVVVFSGDRGGAITDLLGRGGNPSKMQAGQISASGDRGQASASGDRGQASASGDRGQASASGDSGQASASGDRGQASASGDSGQASASGDSGQASASGDSGQASASGDSGQASASGDSGQASASGDSGQASASGYSGQASASGDRGQASASGYSGQASASGYSGQASASGYSGQASASGEHSVAIGNARVAAGVNGTIVSRWWDGSASRWRYVVGYVGEGIEPYFWYSLDAVGNWRKGEPVADALLSPRQIEARRKA